MNKSITFFFTLVVCVPVIVAQSNDSLKTYRIKNVTVFGHKYSINNDEFPVEQNNISSVLRLGGFHVIDEGVSLAQDIYADGLSKGNYTIVVDGERYQSACPMRMDAPISRINPIDIKSIDLVKSSAELQAGLGGVVAIHRSLPTEQFGLEGSVTQQLGSSNETDLALSVDKSKNRISLRYIQGDPYETGNGKSFADLYGYSRNARYQSGDASYYGIFNNWKYTASVMLTGNVSFPYLQMDERRSVEYNSSLAYGNYKMYVNYTDHTMNNGLRVSPMFMETKAKNLTLGVVSSNFEAYYRHWNADNDMTMNSGGMSIYNNMIPELGVLSGDVFKSAVLSSFTLSARAGITYYNVGNKSVASFFGPLYGSTKQSRVFPQAGISVSRADAISSSMSLISQFDVSAVAPQAQDLYIALKRPMGNAYWSGNPNLDEPVRVTLRTSLDLNGLTFGGYASYIYDYVYLDGAISGMQKYQTFANINAFIAGLSMRLNIGDYLQSYLSYTYGENASTKQPLIEIYPFQISTRLSSPEFYNIRLDLEETYNDAQKRIDATLGETPGSAWNAINVGATWNDGTYVVGVDIDNALDNNYSQFLSYERNPFSNGMKVVAPGTTLRINLRCYY